MVLVLVVAAICLAYFIWKAKRKSAATGVHLVALMCISMYAHFQIPVYYAYLIFVLPVSINGQSRNEQLESAPRSRTNEGDHLQDSENRRFTYKDLEKFTDNFKRFIGQGGFGLVYHGHLEDGTEVAVKMRSESSSHGLDEFLAEVPIFQPP